MKLMKSKKGFMQTVSAIYPVILTLGLSFLVVALLVLVLDKFSQSTTLTPLAQSSINAGRDAIGTFTTDWGNLIVLIFASVVIVSLVAGGFFMMGNRGKR